MQLSFLLNCMKDKCEIIYRYVLVDFCINSVLIVTVSPQLYSNYNRFACTRFAEV